MNNVLLSITSPLPTGVEMYFMVGGELCLA